MPTVLIVEDDADTLLMMEFILGSHGYGTMGAPNGRRALEQMRERRPCVVLLDMMMPVMDGWEFRRRQQDDPALASVPVLAVTAVADIRQVEQTLGIPCVRKGDSFSELLEEVRSLCPETGE